jgi:hypothetical protein
MCHQAEEGKKGRKGKCIGAMKYLYAMATRGKEGQRKPFQRHTPRGWPGDETGGRRKQFRLEMISGRGGAPKYQVSERRELGTFVPR